MPTSIGLLNEMIFVGIGLSVLGLVVSYAGDIFSGDEIDYWPNHAKAMILGTFVTGAMFHLLCEIFGVNSWYVANFK